MKTGEMPISCLRGQTQDDAAIPMKLVAEDHLPLVAAMVRRFPWHTLEPEELYQQGCVGLMKALNRYDPAMGTAFSTYAAAMILGEMRMLCRLDAPVHVPRQEREKRTRIRRAQQHLTALLGREPTVDEVAVSLRMEPTELVLSMEEISVSSLDAQTGSGDHWGDLLPSDDPWLDRLLLRDLVSRLPGQDRRLLLLRFRLGLTQAETARRMGTNQVTVSRHEAAAKARLRAMWLQAESV